MADWSNMNYQDMFYNGVIAKIGNFRIDGELPYYDRKMYGNISMYLGYDTLDDRYAHNYIRNKAIKMRKRHIAAKLDGNIVIITTLEDENNVIVFDKAIDFIFKDDANMARNTLLTMLGKLYNVTRKDISPLSMIDFSEYGGDRYDLYEL